MELSLSDTIYSKDTLGISYQPNVSTTDRGFVLANSSNLTVTDKSTMLPTNEFSKQTNLRKLFISILMRYIEFILFGSLK